MVNAADYMNYEFVFRPDAQRFEEGSPNTMSIHAFGAALDLLLETGIENIEQRVMALGDTILEQLQRRGLNIYSSTRPEERSGNIAFVMNQDISRLYEWMLENKVKLTVRDGLVRLSPHFYNSEEEILRFFDLLDKYLKNLPQLIFIPVLSSCSERVKLKKNNTAPRQAGALHCRDSLTREETGNNYFWRASVLLARRAMTLFFPGVDRVTKFLSFSFFWISWASLKASSLLLNLSTCTR